METDRGTKRKHRMILIRWWAEWKKCVCTATQMKILPFVIVKMRFPSQLTLIHTHSPYINILMKFFQVPRWLVRSCFLVDSVCVFFWCEGLIVLPSRCIHSTANNHIYENSFTLMSWSYITGLFSFWNEWQHLLTINNDQRLRYSTLIYKAVKQIQLAGSFTCSGDWIGCGQLVYKKTNHT